MNESVSNQQIASIALSTDTGDFKQVMRDIDENEEEEDIEILDINNNNKQQKQNGNELSQQSFGTYSDDFYARIEEYDLPKHKVMKNGMRHDQTFSIYNTDLYGHYQDIIQIHRDEIHLTINMELMLITEKKKNIQVINRQIIIIVLILQKMY